jgi:hypothetical protein
MNGDNLVILSYYIENHVKLKGLAKILTYYIENHVKLKGLAEININIQALHHFGLTP